MLRKTYIYGLLALLYPVIDHQANFCRITGNYGCTKHSYNCNDLIGYDHVPTFQANDIITGASCFGTLSADGMICCDTDGLNGGYCPNEDELASYRVVPSGSGALQNYQMMPGYASLKCNQVGGPHYCFHLAKTGGTAKCVDSGMYD